METNPTNIFQSPSMEGTNFPNNHVLPPGFRFHPTDEELITEYLHKKISSPMNPILSIMAEIDLYKFDPWELPGSLLHINGSEFFKGKTSQRPSKESLFALSHSRAGFHGLMSLCGKEVELKDKCRPNSLLVISFLFIEPKQFLVDAGRSKRQEVSQRCPPNRAAVSGYWKATGTDKPILSSYGSKCVGVKKALVFYRGRPPKGVKTEWMMYEYKLLDDRRLSTRLRGSMRLDDWVLCRVRQKSNGQFPRRENQEESNHKSFPQTELGGFEERDIIEKMNYLIDSQQVHQEGEVVDAHQQPSLDHFQGGLSGQIFFGMNSNTQIQSHPIFSMKTALQTIKRVLSVGAMDELLVPISPNRRPSSLLNLDKSSLFEIS
ncbi:unnamed protein product [Thlaspi arvense]|uniref:NAC domain-containing protein n=1 Tax=Thlaspi arvense TaxID=13288 RepID=A0AAU9SCN0_THLAR|nr:unnamed protein product [Thlaspi arvense]